MDTFTRILPAYVLALIKATKSGGYIKKLRAVKMKVCTFFFLVTVASSAVAAKSYDGYKVALPN